MRGGQYKGQHHIAAVGIDTSSPTLALYNGYTMFATIGLVHLGFGRLMTTIDDGRRHNPRKERRLLHLADQVLLYLQVLSQRETFGVFGNFKFQTSNSHYRFRQFYASAEAPLDIAVIAEVKIAFQTLLERIVVVVEVRIVYQQGIELISGFE